MKMLVLVVDDDAGWQNTIKTVLEREYELKFIDNIPEASRFLVSTKRKPTAIVLDYHMRDSALTGYDLLDGIKGVADLERIPVVMLSDHPSRGGTALAYKGAAAFVYKKPFEADLLKAHLDKLTGRNQPEFSVEAFNFAGLVADFSRLTFVLDKKSFDLTEKQRALLKILMAAKAKDRIVTRDYMLNYLWPDSAAAKAPEDLVRQLRKTLGAWGRIHIKSVRGVGYRLE